MPVTDALLRMICTGIRRYSRHPEERDAAARFMLVSSLYLYAEHTSAQEAARVAAQVLEHQQKLEAA